MQWQRQQQQQQQSSANDQLPSASLQNSCARHANPQREQQLPTISSSKNSSGSSISSSSSSNLAPTTNCHQPLFKTLAQGTPTPSGSSNCQQYPAAKTAAGAASAAAAVAILCQRPIAISLSSKGLHKARQPPAGAATANNIQQHKQQQEQQQSCANDQLPSASLQKSCTRHANPQREQQLPTISSSKNSSGSSNISSSSSSNLAPTTPM